MGKVAICLALALAGCGSTGGSFCLVARPIVPAQEDVATASDSLVEQVVSHNETGSELCGWQP